MCTTEDELDEFDDESINWSQDDPLSSNEIIGVEVLPESNGNSQTASLCRLCAGQAINPVYIYSELGESMRLAHKINTCLSVKV